MTSKNRVILLIHGGAADKMDLSKKILFKTSIKDILSKVYPKLFNGLSAKEAVVQAVKLLEDDPLFNAGNGSKFQSDGKIRMSASLMSTESKRFSGVFNVEDVKNPIEVALKLQNEADRCLASKEAEAWAKKKGIKFKNAYTFEALKEFVKAKKGKSGTVGAVALDLKGHLAAATSTGGKGNEIPGRVSDSATVAGNYANQFAAVSATGTGEEIVEHAVAARLATLIECGHSLEEAAENVFKKAKKSKAYFGFISIDSKGAYATKHTSPDMVWGLMQDKKINIFK